VRRLAKLLLAVTVLLAPAASAPGSELFLFGKSRGRVELRLGVGSVEAHMLQNASTEREWDATAYQPALVLSFTGKGPSSDFRFRGLFSETESVEGADVDLDSYDLRTRAGWGWELRKRTVLSLLGALSYRSWKSHIKTDGLSTDYDAEVICLGGHLHLRSGLVKDRLYLSAQIGAEAPVEGGAAYGAVGTSRLNGDVIIESRLGMEWCFAEGSWLTLGCAWEKAKLDFGGGPNTVDAITTTMLEFGLTLTF
jgi:hypothetical protein